MSCSLLLGRRDRPHLATAPLQAGVGSDQVPPSLLFSRLSTLGSPRCPSSDSCSSPFTAPLPISGHAPAPLHPPWSQGPKTEPRIRGAAPPAPTVRGQSLPGPAGHSISDASQDGFLATWLHCSSGTEARAKGALGAVCPGRWLLAFGSAKLCRKGQK